MAKKDEVKLIITSDNKGALQGIGGVTSMLKDLSDKSKGFVDRIKSHWIGFTAATASVAGAIYTTKRIFQEFDEAVQRQEKRIAFENLANSVGQNARKIVSDVRAAAGEMLSYQKSLELTGQAMLLGLEPGTIVRLTEISRASSKVTGQTITQAFSDITLGVARQSKLILDNLGILVDYDTHLKHMQVALGKTESQLTDTDRRQAFLNATFEAGDRIISRVGKSTNSLNDELQRTKARIEDLKTELKDEVFLKNSEQFIDLQKDAAYVVEHQLTPALKALLVVYGELSDVARTFWEMVSTPIKPFFDVGKSAGELLDNYIEINRLQRETLELNEQLGSKRLDALDNVFVGATDKGYQEILDEYRKLQSEVAALQSSMTPEEAVKWQEEYASLVDKTAQKILDNLDVNAKAAQQWEEEYARIVDETAQKILDNLDANAKAAQQWEEEYARIVDETAQNILDNLEANARAQEEADELTKRSARDVLETYEGMYEALRFDSERYFEYRKGLLDKQRDEEIAITGDLALAWEAYYARLQELEEQRTLRSDDFAGGIKVYYSELEREGFTWAKGAKGMMEDTASGMHRTLSSNIKAMVKDGKSLGDAWKDTMAGFAEAFIDAVIDMITQWMIFKAITMIGGAFAGGFSGPSGGPTVANSGAGYNPLGGGGSWTYGGGGGSVKAIGAPIAVGAQSIQRSEPITVNQSIHFEIKEPIDAYSFDKYLKKSGGTIKKIVGDGVNQSQGYAKQLRGGRN
jgi:lambda family phage tail tape measure protein